MINTIIHIGRHKTGTTALQNYLYDNRGSLKEKGFYYLYGYRREKAHHLLSEYLASAPFKALNEEDKNIELQKIQHNIIDEVNDNTDGTKTIIISSEAFQNVTPRYLKAIFHPDAFNVQIVSYFREQVGYTASSYNQEIHAKIVDIDLDNFITRFNADYDTFMVSWSRNFSHIYVGIFDKEILFNGDIVDDFFKNILNIDLVNMNKSYFNPSLSQKYLAFKLQYNRKVIKEELPHLIGPGKMYTLLGFFSKHDKGAKFMLNYEQRQVIIEKYQESNRIFLSKYCEDSEFHYSVCDDSKSTLQISEKEFWSIYEKIDTHKWPI